MQYYSILIQFYVIILIPIHSDGRKQKIKFMGITRARRHRFLGVKKCKLSINKTDFLTTIISWKPNTCSCQALSVNRSTAQYKCSKRFFVFFSIYMFRFPSIFFAVVVGVCVHAGAINSSCLLSAIAVAYQHRVCNEIIHSVKLHNTTWWWRLKTKCNSLTHSLTWWILFE